MATITSRDRAPVVRDGVRLHILDQTLLPGREAWLELRGARDTAEATSTSTCERRSSRATRPQAHSRFVGVRHR